MRFFYFALNAALTQWPLHIAPGHGTRSSVNPNSMRVPFQDQGRFAVLHCSHSPKPTHSHKDYFNPCEIISALKSNLHWYKAAKTHFDNMTDILGVGAFSNILFGLRCTLKQYPCLKWIQDWNLSPVYWLIIDMGFLAVDKLLCQHNLLHIYDKKSFFKQSKKQINKKINKLG